MKTDPTDLSRLHDILLPSAVSWWPLAPGWYVLLGLVVLTALWLSLHLHKKWRANGYRRQALAELQRVKGCSAIAELLRRTALAVVPRAEIAGKTGAAWADWLDSHCPAAMPAEAHRLLAGGVYDPSGKEQDIDILRSYAACWIRQHQLPAQSAQSATKPVEKKVTQAQPT